MNEAGIYSEPQKFSRELKILVGGQNQKVDGDLRAPLRPSACETRSEIAFHLEFNCIVTVGHIDSALHRVLLR